MKNLFIALLFVALSAIAEDASEPPTYVADPNHPDYATGAASEPLTFEQVQAERELSEAAAREGYTFDWDASQVGRYQTGYLPKGRPMGPVRRLGDGEALSSFDLKMFGRSQPQILNQGNCGSCVIFAFTRGVMNQFLLKGVPLDLISMQHYMTCSSGSQCGGAYGLEIAQDAVRLGKSGGFYFNKDVPYTAKSGRCINKPGYEKGGVIVKYEDIDGSAKAMLSALHKGFSVQVGIAANSSFQSYRSGIYNACNSTSINHYVTVEGIDCGKAVDKNGICQFDESGELVGREKSEAIIRIANSWGENWGEDGFIRMRLYGKNGRRCNGVAGFEGDAQILDNGMPMPQPGPSEFELKSEKLSIKVTVKPGAPFTFEQLKGELALTLKSLDKVKQ